MIIHSMNGLFIDSKVKSGKLSCPFWDADRLTKSHEKWLTYLLTHQRHDYNTVVAHQFSSKVINKVRTIIQCQRNCG